MKVKDLHDAVKRQKLNETNSKVDSDVDDEEEQQIVAANPPRKKKKRSGKKTDEQDEGYHYFPTSSL